MKKLPYLSLAAMLALAACQTAPQATLGPDGKPIPVAYRITPKEEAQIPVRLLGQVNILRQQSGLAPLALSPQLNAASMAHARDMAAQNRAWHFGSDGASALDRAKRQGYFGPLIGENISETYENEISTLSAWMQARDTRDVIMDPSATQLGIGWLQEPTNKILSLIHI